MEGIKEMESKIEGAVIEGEIGILEGTCVMGTLLLLFLGDRPTGCLESAENLIPNS